MIETLQKIILDGQDNLAFNGVARNIGEEHIAGKASIYIGIRRSGKSTYMRQIVKQLLSQGTRKEQIVWINFVDDRLHRLRTREWELDKIIEAYRSLYPEILDKPVYYFLDEIQEIPEWEYFVDRLLRSPENQVYITGSSAKLLSTEIATQMRGRSLAWEVFPFSFAEFLRRHNMQYVLPGSTSQMARMQAAFENYWQEGGFPEVHGVSSSLRVRIHQEYMQSILYRDLIDRHDIRHPRSLLDLVHRLLENAGTLQSLNKLTAFLDERGYKTHKALIADYLAWLEDAYFIFSVPIYDASASRRNRTPKKIYAIDHALIRSVTPSILVNNGHLLENYVFGVLRRHTTDIYYYKSKAGKEVDFAVQDSNRGLHCMQVAESVAREDTRTRELTSLLSALHETESEVGYIVTRHEEEKLEMENKEIHIIPAYKTEHLASKLLV